MIYQEQVRRIDWLAGGAEPIRRRRAFLYHPAISAGKPCRWYSAVTPAGQVEGSVVPTQSMK